MTDLDDLIEEARAVAGPKSLYAHTSVAHLLTRLADALVAAGVAPQVPSQNETKSGNNFVSLDPEKMAEVMLDAETALGDLPGSYGIAKELARALCEAYTEGKLT